MSEQVKKNTGGRPVKTLKRDIIIRIRLDKQEEFTLRQRAREAGKNLSQYIRQAAIAGKVMARLTREQQDQARKLVGISTNINQLARDFKRAGMAQTAFSFEECRQVIDTVLQSFRHDQ